MLNTIPFNFYELFSIYKVFHTLYKVHLTPGWHASKIVKQEQILLVKPDFVIRVKLSHVSRFLFHVSLVFSAPKSSRSHSFAHVGWNMSSAICMHIFIRRNYIATEKNYFNIKKLVYILLIIFHFALTNNFRTSRKHVFPWILPESLKGRNFRHY